MGGTVDISGYLDEYRRSGDIVIRTKWTMDGARTLGDAAERLRALAAQLDALGEAGFHLQEPVDDDWGFVHRADEMSADDVLEVLTRLDDAGLRYWVDGSWALEALGRWPDRVHVDLDLAMPREQIHRAERALDSLGFAHAELIVPGMPSRLVLRDEQGRQVDIRVLELDEDGNGFQELEDDELALYAREELRGSGTVAGRTVPCVAREMHLAGDTPLN